MVRNRWISVFEDLGFELEQVPPQPESSGCMISIKDLSHHPAFAARLAAKVAPPLGVLLWGGKRIQGSRGTQDTPIEYAAKLQHPTKLQSLGHPNRLRFRPARNRPCASSQTGGEPLLTTLTPSDRIGDAALGGQTTPTLRRSRLSNVELC